MTEDDTLDDVMAFVLRIRGALTVKAYEMLREFFKRKLNLSSESVLMRRMANLSEIRPVMYDMCPNSCLAYTGRYNDEESCIFCGEDRYFSPSMDGTSLKPKRQFAYIPLISQIKALFLNEEMVKIMGYRANYNTETYKDGFMQDFFDGKLYRDRLSEYVTIRGKQLDHRYFSGKHDIAFALTTDGVAIFPRQRLGGPVAWPIAVINLNLPPDIRTHLENIIVLGVVPGPTEPKDIGSFLYPFIIEAEVLAKGVSIPSYDSLHQQDILLDVHAYTLMAIVDIPAGSKLLNVKGQNGRLPCRLCWIQAIWVPPRGPYYCPLHEPDRLDGTPSSSYDPLKLKRRDHESFQEAVDSIRAQPTKTARDKRSTELGVTGISVLSLLPGFDLARGVPFEFMHLAYENNFKNLFLSWTARFKDIDHEAEGYVIPSELWETIGDLTQEATKTIPSSFVSSLPNIYKPKSRKVTAEHWAFWSTYIAPAMLKDAFPDQNYYDHFIRLVDIVKALVKFEIPLSSLQDLRKLLAQWVVDYET
jgi:hypothetical protein